MAKDKQNLSPEVAAKYAVTSESFLYGKCNFPYYKKHGVDAKLLSELTLAEADALFAAGAVKGVLTLKEAAQAAKK